ncbi:Tfp pilus assembly protein PilW [Legionella pneumophila]|uniref:PilW family protein n=1 Tax=Legionella pneumophila TaxID=446 RepID=UPI0005CB2D12|nr:PilW family protein [Legionella pneumophila]HAT8828438.1 prepilin-type N-terminal cleavage/methylation domain-containing protein [Legionella pneumophila subsp. pneumophila]WAI79858.1 PilW family protein [Legionella pneumophila]CZH08946.1 Tfp pilus assembly protein PilW [Legionella pneumophila]CZI32075.1 Tfp pilus assembly protein PilW [Legionella pneumophila]HAT4693449.1 prepilin-type N-terminal cleavage/methylation domain-containing protein [Legionella pneumophila]
MNINYRLQQGFSLVELMIATLVGLILTYSILQIYLAQTQLYKASNSQDLIQSTENAISNLLIPMIRSAGFAGCGSIITAVSILNAGGPRPLGILNTTPTILMGYNGSGASFTITQSNPANSTNASHWSPALDSTLVGNAQQGSDVLVVLGSTSDSYPTGITTIDPGSNTFVVQGTSGMSLTSGMFGAVSDCGKTVIFQITGVAGTTITHDAGAGVLQNASSAFPVNFQTGSQFIPIQQTAFFVGQGQGGQSALMRASLVGNSWTIQPLVPGVEIMKVQYGIGNNGVITRYVSANAVTDWAQVYAIRLGFLIAGQPGSGSLTTRQYNVLDTQITVPADNRLRHVFELTINLRNSIS